MPGSITSTFSEADDFEAALGEEGCRRVLVTGRGAFRARLTQVALHHLRLCSAEEHLARIAFVAVPAEMIQVVLVGHAGPAPVWGGIAMQAGEIMTLGAGHRLHARTGGPCRWGSIWVPAAELVRYGSALTGTVFTVRCAVQCWRPRPAAGRHLRHLYRAAIDTVENRSRAPINRETAHGLEQQLIGALVECLSHGAIIATPPVTREHQELAVRFEALLQAESERSLRITEIAAALGVSTQTLRLCCEMQLGMSPTGYARRRRMQLVHRALRKGSVDGARVLDMAQRYGFRGLGKFAADYRAIYGELPSATVRRAAGGGVSRLVLRRRRSGI